jgi:hypothetical protein
MYGLGWLELSVNALALRVISGIRSWRLAANCDPVATRDGFLKHVSR